MISFKGKLLTSETGRKSVFVGLDGLPTSVEVCEPPNVRFAANSWSLSLSLTLGSAILCACSIWLYNVMRRWNVAMAPSGAAYIVKAVSLRHCLHC